MSRRSGPAAWQAPEADCPESRFRVMAHELPVGHECEIFQGEHTRLACSPRHPRRGRRRFHGNLSSKVGPSSFPARAPEIASEGAYAPQRVALRSRLDLIIRRRGTSTLRSIRFDPGPEVGEAFSDRFFVSG
jgi:hypothetical protein